MKTISFDVKNQLDRLCALVEKMLTLSGMMRGSFGPIYQRCGKPTCWCADIKEKGHLCMRLMWSEGGGVKTRSVRPEDQQIIKEAVGQYRQYRELRRDLRIEEDKLNDLLDELERNTTQSNKEKMGYL
ncbi:MAG TPA: DUF6788 family protein [Chitinivibrionales bacterium]